MPSEPRFTVDCPFVFSRQLRERYTPEEIAQRADVDIERLPPEEREQVIETLLYEDLEEVTAYEEEFGAGLRQELEPMHVRVFRLDYEESDLWNGVSVQDRLFPSEESFDVHEYRQTVEQVTETLEKIRSLLHTTVPPLNGNNGHHKKKTTPTGFE